MLAVNSTEAMFKTVELTAGKKKFALYFYCSTDFHHVESSNQIICYIIQSKKSEILALIIFSKFSGEEYKVEKPTLFTNVNYSIVL